jgi:small subunit ribosomal protein S17
METRPISRLKRWRIINIIEVAVTADVAAVSEQDVVASIKA